MITVEKSQEVTMQVLDFMNALRKDPITLQGFKNQRVKEAKSKHESYDSITGGLVPYESKSEKYYVGTISVEKMLKIMEKDDI